MHRSRSTAPARFSSEFVCRVSGLPVGYVEALRASRSAALADALCEAGCRLRGEREWISGLLYRVVGMVRDRKARATLLVLKRDLYNLRLSAPESLSVLRGVVSPGEWSRVAAFRDDLDRYREMRAGLALVYREETDAARERLREAVRDPDFQKGLLISSRSLHRALERYLAGGGEPRTREEKTERGLLRYLTRMAMKATPFGTFCAVVPGSFDSGEAPGGTGVLRGDPRTKRSFVRINKSICGILLDHLRGRPTVRRSLVVELNPTLRGDGGQLVFLSSVRNREVFQRLADNEVLAWITGMLRRNPTMTLGALVSALCADPELDATEGEAEAYLDRLLEIGFLRFRTGVREQDPDWDRPLRALLEGIEDDHAREASALLAVLRRRAEAYAGAGVPERAALGEEMEERVRTAFQRMEIRTRPHRGMPFYEDATAPAELVLPREGVERAGRDLLDFVRHVLRLAWPRPEQATMRHFFTLYYGPEVRSVALLEFYEDFFREHFKAHLDRVSAARGGRRGTGDDGYEVSNPYGLDSVRRLHAARDRLTRLFQARWAADPAAEEVRITRAELEEVLAGVSEAPAAGHSVAVYCQFVPSARGGAAPMLVLHDAGCHAGYGKWFSRFLYMLPERIRERVRERNEELTESRLAEICGDAHFNANLHPPLLPWEISYPTGESGAAEEQLPGAELLVECDPEDPHALLLRHGPSGERVVPVDLGFLNPQMRPPLYQLLSRFAPPSVFKLTFPETPYAPVPGAGAPERTGLPATERVVHRPRLVYGDTLVLARRRWTVPGSLFPRRTPDEAPCDYFLRVSHWRVEHGLPREGYVRVRPLPSPDARPAPGESPEETAPEKPHTAGSRDLHKPQYVDFASPLLLNLLERTVAGLRRFQLVVEERLPSTEALPRQGDDGYAAELIVEIDFADGAPAAPLVHREEYASVA